MKPFFSIVLPTYNRAKFLRVAIKSVLDQGFADWELLIVDDGSTDDTKAVVHSIKDARIKYIYQENAERAAARNNGIDNAEGEYICFLDSDDEYLDNHLEALKNKITEKKFAKGIYVSGVIREHNDQRIEIPFQDKSTFKNDVSFLLLANETTIPTRVAIQREILEEYKFNETLNISEDTELFSRILVHYPLIQLKDKTVIYKLHEDNTNNLKNNPYKGQLKALKKIFNNPMVSVKIPLVVKRKKLGFCHWGMARYYIEKKKVGATYYNIFMSFFYTPIGISFKNRIYGLYSVLLN
jgi:glycosyltransferase involved in cell wall biosynthesis